MGRFTMSFDCEGRWGTADFDTEFEAKITDESLVSVYDRLFSCLAEAGVKATFAVVGAFSLTADELRDHALLREPPSNQHAAWVSRARTQILDLRDSSGWTLPTIEQRVLDGGHELATHGFSHLPFGAKPMGQEALSAEVAMLAEWLERPRTPVSSIVFPRNQVNRLAELKNLGITTHRRRIDRDYGAGVTAAEVVNEISPFGTPESIADATVIDGDIVGLPPGRFFNRRVGVRRLVPPLVTARSWASTLQRAAKDPDATAHLWLHPHNLLESESQFRLLEKVIAHAGRLATEGRLEIATMADLASAVRC